MNKCNFSRFYSKLCLCAHDYGKWEVAVQFHILLSLTLDEIEWSASHSSCFIPRESGLSTHRIQGEWDPEPGWTLQRPEKSPHLCQPTCTTHQCCTKSSVLLFNHKISYYSQNIQTVLLAICKHNFLYVIWLFSYQIFHLQKAMRAQLP
jgi:hypothetical protein